MVGDPKAEHPCPASASLGQGAREFYIDESSNGERYFIDGNLVSQKEFTKRRHKECVHVGGKAQFYEFCQNCGLQFRAGQGAQGPGEQDGSWMEGYECGLREGRARLREEQR